MESKLLTHICNAQKMRDALKDVRNKLEEWNLIPGFDYAQYSSLCDIIDDAISAPPRNCDVGTADEQWVRFNKHCEENSQADDPDYCSSSCDVDGECVSQCALKWGQMPYEKE